MPRPSLSLSQSPNYVFYVQFMFVCVVTVGLAIGNVKFTRLLHEWELTYQRCMVSVPRTFIMPSFLSLKHAMWNKFMNNTISEVADTIVKKLLFIFRHTRSVWNLKLHLVIIMVILKTDVKCAVHNLMAIPTPPVYNWHTKHTCKRLFISSMLCISRAKKTCLLYRSPANIATNSCHLL